MALGKPFKGLFRKGLRGNLDDPAERRAVFEAVCNEAKKQRSNGSAANDEWRKPIEQAREILVAEGRDDLELLRVAIAVADDETARKELIHRGMNAAHMEVDDLPFLEMEAKDQLRNLRLWNRLFEEARHHKRKDLRDRFRESFVLALIPLFPARDESMWYDVDTESQARSMFLNHLDELLDDITKSKRQDDNALAIMRAARAQFPERSSITSDMVPMLVGRGLADPDSLEVLLQALLVNQDDMELRCHAGKLLIRRPGHEVQGFEMLLPCFDAEPEDEELFRLLVDHIKTRKRIEEEWFHIVEKWLEQNPDDKGMQRKLAYFRADNDEVGPEAAAAYRAALEEDPDNVQLIQLLGECEAAEENWNEVAELFERLRKLCGPSKNINTTLAKAWAMCGRTDPEAEKLYQEIIEAGAKCPAAHNRYCEIIFRRDPSASGSVRQFRLSHQVDAQGYWANVGLATMEHKAKNHPRVIEIAADALKAHPEGEEMLGIAAKSVAANPMRATIRPLLTLPPAVALDVFTRAHEINDEALLILTNMVRYRLLLKVNDEATRELLNKVLVRDSTQQELLVRYGDMLWDAGDKAEAIKVYQRLLGYVRESTKNSTTNTTNFGRVSLADRGRVLERVANECFANPEQSVESTELLYELALDPDIEPEMVLRIAKALRTDTSINPLRVPLLERAAGLNPEDVEIELALAEARSSRGAPSKALRVVLDRALVGKNDELVIETLNRIIPALKPNQMASEVARAALGVAGRKKRVPRELKAALARVIARVEAPPEEARSLLKEFAQDEAIGAEATEAIARIEPK